LIKEVEKRRLQVAVAGIPKTIDNDIAVSFLAVICFELVPKWNFKSLMAFLCLFGFLFSLHNHPIFILCWEK
jgi:hypothetical protein